MTLRLPLLLDSDPALGVIHDGRPRDVDDGLAIIEAINSDAVDLRGLTITYGNAPLDKALAVARELLRRKDAFVPLAGGAAAAMPTDGTRAPITPAVQLLAKALADRPCHIAAIGPLTNIGTLLQHIPELSGRIESVVVVAGRTAGNPFYLGDVGPVRDFNFENDPLAARILLESGVPVVMAGFELSSQVTVTAGHLKRILRHDTRLARHLYDRSEAWFKHWTSTFPADDGFHPWDSAAIAWYTHPELFTTEQRGWRIRDVELDTADLGRNPDDTPAAVPWLETRADWADSARPPVTFLTGFAEGGAERFLDGVVEGVW